MSQLEGVLESRDQLTNSLVFEVAEFDPHILVNVTWSLA